MTRFVVIDTETTGIDPEVDRVVEIASVAVMPGIETPWRVTRLRASLVNPARPIPPEASAVHHLVDADVVSSPSLDEAVGQVVPPLPDGNEMVIVAHNAAFDSKFLPQFSNKQWLCTYRCALHLYPDAPSHSNQTLRYWLGLQPPFTQMDEANKRNAQPHAALFDAVTTAALLMQMLETNDADYLCRLQFEPVLLATVRFGQHRGKKWADVPLSYLEWVLKQNFDTDVKHTARHYLESRTNRRSIAPAPIF